MTYGIKKRNYSSTFNTQSPLLKKEASEDNFKNYCGRLFNEGSNKNVA